jgi:outer membrane protein assembly factor BamB
MRTRSGKAPTAQLTVSPVKAGIQLFEPLLYSATSLRFDRNGRLRPRRAITRLLSSLRLRTLAFFWMGFVIADLAANATFGQIKTDWPMTAFDISHDGYNPYEITISPLNVGSLKLKWSYRAPKSGSTSVNPTFHAQPTVATGVQVGSQLMDLVLVGDNSGVFVALDANSPNPAGTVVWSQTVGSVQPACPRSKASGIIGSPVLDRAAQAGRGAVYVGNNGFVFAFDLATGALLPGWPISIPNHSIPLEGFIHAGLTLANGLLYVTNASKCDYDPFHGQITVFDTASATIIGQWWTMSGSASLPSQGGGSIWGPGGVSVDPTPETGGVFVATGNGRPNGNPSEIMPYAESVVQLAPDLSQVIAAHQPGFIVGDDDIASTSLLFAPTGCPTPLLAAQRKSGELYVYRRNFIGLLRPQIIKVLNSVGQWRGGPAWDPVAQLLLVASSGDGVPPFSGGLIALRMTAPCRFGLAWQDNTDLQGQPIVGPGAAMPPPTVANGVAYIGVAATQKPPASTYRIYAIADQSVGNVSAGQTLWQSQQFNGAVEAAPVVVNGMVLVGTDDQHLYAYTLFGE